METETSSNRDNPSPNLRLSDVLNYNVIAEYFCLHEECKRHIRIVADARSHADAYSVARW